ncbi:hypothetical protein ABFU49_05430 [Xanthomonas campestris pv. campestris]|uniref:hypothetical protein n=1 Tax=Xanthomonas campestris TaxID=339 RepID=UPI001A1735B0|nr:hypothetical protein [Xanthomonas campestris]MBF9173185.1 hypothetical protein [Xanthomonas campestris pv. campestris]MDO0846766.1 hypothetical protein [Xanthomonas campestris pv. campestris]MEB1411969.1 hypothetical protein [Xanthomonas campestris pv. campestris]MEB1457940.1 hypothetical protein [Xanthomonas campestris pv. campestris]MEB1498786.1 hypothetical protein [Xanthomonas campestris pv. campestris]
MSIIKAIWKDPVGSKLIVAGISTICAAAWATFKGWWPSIFGGIGVLWNWFGSSSKHPNWLLLLLWGVALLALLRVAVRVVFHLRGSVEPEVTWRSYRRDHFHGVDWQWDYTSGAGAKIISLTPLCPSCECVLVHKVHDYFSSNFAYGLYCTHCGRNAADFRDDYHQLCQSTEILIDRKVRSGDWRNVGG